MAALMYVHIKPMITRVSIGIFRITKTRDIHYNVKKGRWICETYWL